MKVYSSSVRTGKVQLLNLALFKAQNFVKLPEDSSQTSNAENYSLVFNFSSTQEA